MAELDRVLEQAEELLQASGVAKQKGLASEITLENISKNIAAMAKKAGVKGTDVEAVKQKKATKDSTKALETVSYTHLTLPTITGV